VPGRRIRVDIVGHRRRRGVTVTVEQAQLADLLRVDQDPRRPVEWREVLNQNRSESGLGVAEVLSAFPKDTGNLRDAVLSDYRSEADAAYRGVDHSDELRWDGPA
jgi:hypothetical protein